MNPLSVRNYVAVTVTKRNETTTTMKNKNNNTSLGKLADINLRIFLFHSENLTFFAKKKKKKKQLVRNAKTYFSAENKVTSIK